MRLVTHHLAHVATCSAALLAIACGGGACKSKATKPEPVAPTTSTDDAGDAAAEKSAPTPAALLPSGAIDRFGEPRLHSPDAINRIEVDDKGHLLTCGNHSVRLWDAASGRLLWSRVAVLGNAACALSPDGRYVAFAQGGIGNTPEQGLADWQAGHVTVETDTLASGPTRGLVFSPDGTKLAILQNSLRVRAVPGFEKRAQAREVAVRATWTADGSIIAAGGSKLLRWNPAGSDKTGQVLATLPSRCLDAAFDAGGKIAAFTTGKQVGLVDLATGNVSIMAIDAPASKQVALSPDGALLAVGSKTGVSVWEVTGAKKLWQATTRYLPAPAFSADGSKLYYSSILDLVTADARTGKSNPAEPRTSFAGWANDSKVILKQQQTTWAIDPRTKARADTVDAPTPPAGLPAWADEIVRGADGTVLAYAGDRVDRCGSFDVWVAGSGKKRLSAPPKCDPDANTDTWLPAAGVVVAANTPKPQVWDALTGKRLLELDPGERTLEQVALSGDRKLLLVVLGPAPDAGATADVYHRDEPTDGTRFETWSLADGKLLHSLEVDKTGVTALAASKDGGLAFVGWSDGAVDSIDTSTMADLHPLGTQASAIASLELSPDGSLLASTDRDPTTVIWPAKTPR